MGGGVTGRGGAGGCASRTLSSTSSGLYRISPVCLQADLIIVLLKAFARKSLNTLRNSSLLNFSSPICVASLTASVYQCFSSWKTYISSS